MTLPKSGLATPCTYGPLGVKGFFGGGAIMAFWKKGPSIRDTM
jgi:hypothetical protein